MAKILIKGGRVISPAQKLDETCDILIDKGKIAAIGKGLDGKGAEVIDASGKVVTPGLIDIHVHLRDPGLEYKEDIVSGNAVGGHRRLHCSGLHAEHQAGQRQPDGDHLHHEQRPQNRATAGSSRLPASPRGSTANR